CLYRRSLIALEARSCVMVIVVQSFIAELFKLRLDFTWHSLTPFTFPRKSKHKAGPQAVPCKMVIDAGFCHWLMQHRTTEEIFYSSTNRIGFRGGHQMVGCSYLGS